MKNMKRPNIVFYFSDQQRADTLGCYGQRLPVSPNLDALAAKGTRFSMAFTNQPVCGPARAILQTGKYATEVGCYTNGLPLPPDEVTLAARLGLAGYDTAYIGKWHLASDRKKGIVFRDAAVPQDRRGGYDHWIAADALEMTSHGYNGYMYDRHNQRVDFTGYRADCVNNYAVDYIREHKGKRPFFLFVSQLEPHHQNDRNLYEGPDGSKSRFADYDIPGDLEGTEGDWRANYPDYLGCCASLDANVGRLFDTLRYKGLDDNTIFIYTTDHGSHFRTRNREYKRSCHDASLHIPMIIHGPGFEGGKVVDELVSLIDLPSTILECAEVPVPEDYRGRKLRSMINDPSAQWDNSVFTQISESQVGRCVRTKKWKYSVRADCDGIDKGSSDIYYEDFLYDLENDPYERNNLVDCPGHAKKRSEMASLLIMHMQGAGEAAPEILPYSGGFDLWYR